MIFGFCFEPQEHCLCQLTAARRVSGLDQLIGACGLNGAAILYKPFDFICQLQMIFRSSTLKDGYGRIPTVGVCVLSMRGCKR
jgi:hypothetical protein